MANQNYAGQNRANQGDGGGRSRSSSSCLVKGCLVFVVLGLIALALLWTPITLAFKAVGLMPAFQTMMTEDLPALQTEFPFDEKKPPEFNAALFQQYIQARTDLCAPLETLLGELKDLKGMPKEPSLGEWFALIKTFGPQMEHLKIFFESVGPTLRDAEMNIETYAWITQQIWGGIAQAGGSGEQESAKAILESAYQEMRKLDKSSNPEFTDSFLLSKEVIRRLGENFDNAKAQQAWSVVAPNLEKWNGSPAWYVLDMILLEGVKEKMKEAKAMSEEKQDK